MSDNSADTVLCGKNEAAKLSPIALAFMGDAVYETLVRNYLISVLKLPTAKLHNACVEFVNAASQAEVVRKLSPALTGEESTIMRRGRNANTSHIPRNASPVDYHNATGLEALFGYLFLCSRFERITELFGIILKFKGTDSM